MKKYKNKLLLVLILLSANLFSQIPITNTIAIGPHTTTLGNSPGTYLKDINGVYNSFLGSWSWTNGNEIITFTFKKITQYYWAEFRTYHDFIVADYKYTKANGVVIIDTSIQTGNSADIEDYKMFSAGMRNGKFPFSFKDVLLSKSGRIIFTINNSTPNQMHYKLKNYGQTVVEGTPFVTNAFSIPDDITVTKE
jgi:hypothetical protein